VDRANHALDVTLGSRLQCQFASPPFS
jgi:hypothetical protein